MISPVSGAGTAGAVDAMSRARHCALSISPPHRFGQLRSRPDRKMQERSMWHQPEVHLR